MNFKRNNPGMDIQAFIQTINTVLKKTFADYQGVYFIGSRSRGDYREDSDYDMVFVFQVKPDWRKKDKVREIVYRKELEHDIVIDGKYYAYDEIKNYHTPFQEVVYKEGKFYGI